MSGEPPSRGPALLRLEAVRSSLMPSERRLCDYLLHHAEAVLAALSADGVADRGFDGYFGPTTIGDTMANFYGWDLAVHAWDVARATGQDSPIDDAEARELAAGAGTPDADSDAAPEPGSESAATSSRVADATA